MATRIPNLNKLFAGLLPLAAAGALFVPAASAAPSRPGPDAARAAARAQISEGFHVHNLSSHPILLLGESGSANFEGRPERWSVLNPGAGYQDWELQFQLFVDKNATAYYGILGDDGQQHGTFNVTMNLSGLNRDTWSSCQTSQGVCQTSSNGRDIYLFDAPNTVRNIPADQRNAQAAALKQLCIDSSEAKCTFRLKSETTAVTPPHQVGHTVYNDGDGTVDRAIDTTETVTQTNSLNLEVSARGGSCSRLSTWLSRRALTTAGATRSRSGRP
jgi:hypothetical protein